MSKLAIDLHRDDIGANHFCSLAEKIEPVLSSILSDKYLAFYIMNASNLFINNKQPFYYNLYPQKSSLNRLNSKV